MNTIQKVQEIFAKKVKIDKLTPTVELRELGLDSLDLVELMMDIEEEFKIEFDNDEMVGFKTIHDVVKAIEAKVKK
ncbi:MAG: phosphopantetheine-binding protein [Firmicutes bacterium]|nr:phosphopantetheine-binding protein [Bacillota bacterium]